jgi:DNA-directed RNA polymerase subunit RPC12/RpoP
MYSIQSLTDVRYVLGVEMASWVLNCSNCKSKFVESKIPDAGLANYFMPLKPEFPPKGRELQCPNCGQKATYKKQALIYQA